MQHRKHRAKARCFHIFISFFAAKSQKMRFFNVTISARVQSALGLNIREKKEK